MYVHRRALFACRVKATEEAFACGGSSAGLQLQTEAGQALQLLKCEGVPLYTWRTMQVMRGVTRDASDV
jgi:hypothetical protein